MHDFLILPELFYKRNIMNTINWLICTFRCTCVDFVSGTLASTRSVDECAVVLSRYREAFTAIVNEILKKLQFRFNSSALEEMDDEKIGKVFNWIHKVFEMKN